MNQLLKSKKWCFHYSLLNLFAMLLYILSTDKASKNIFFLLYFFFFFPFHKYFQFFFRICKFPYVFYTTEKIKEIHLYYLLYQKNTKFCVLCLFFLCFPIKRIAIELNISAFHLSIKSK